MRKLISFSLLVLSGCVGAPSYRTPTVRIAPEYVATATTPTPVRRMTADSCPPESSLAAPARSVHYTAAMPVARELLPTAEIRAAVGWSNQG